ncbi:12960_t:CDS:2, partial [Dentiscutata heterogama]
WTKPDTKLVKERLTELISLVDSLTEIKKEQQDCFLRRCLAETLNPNKLKNSNLMNFFCKYLPNTVENEFNDAFNLYSSLKNRNL